MPIWIKEKPTNTAQDDEKHNAAQDDDKLNKQKMKKQIYVDNNLFKWKWKEKQFREVILGQKLTLKSLLLDGWTNK
jgi:hypothetical protein